MLAEYIKLINEKPEMFTNPVGASFIIETDYNKIAQIEQQKVSEYESLGQNTENAKIGIVYSDHYIMVIRDAVTFSDGSAGTYQRIIFNENVSNGVAILPIFENQIVLIHHFRHATREWHWEIPRGFGDQSKESHNEALRELKEEIQADISQITFIGEVMPDSGMTNSKAKIYLARLNSVGKIQSLEGIVDLRLFSKADFMKKIEEGNITDSFTLASYVLATSRGIL